MIKIVSPFDSVHNVLDTFIKKLLVCSVLFDDVSE